MNKVFEELLSITERVKATLDAMNYTDKDRIIYICLKPDMDLEPYWSISDVNDEQLDCYGSAYLKERKYNEMVRNFNILTKRCYFLENYNEKLQELLQREMLRPPDKGGSEYEKVQQHFNSLY